MANKFNSQRIYYVHLLGEEAKAICTYQAFEFMGIVCKHILSILMKKYKLDKLPYHYVVERWTSSKGHVMIEEYPIMRKSKLVI